MTKFDDLKVGDAFKFVDPPAYIKYLDREVFYKHTQGSFKCLEKPPQLVGEGIIWISPDERANLELEGVNEQSSPT